MLNLWNMFCEYIQISYHRLLWVILFAVVFYIGFYILSKKRSKKDIVFKAMLSMACSFVFVMTLFSRTPKEYCVTWKPFWSYYMAAEVNNTELWLQIIMNIAMYVPIGFSLPGCFDSLKKGIGAVLIAVASSVGIELIQYVLSIGYFDVDDVLNNILGTIIGWSLYKLWDKITHKFEGETK